MGLPGTLYYPFPVPEMVLLSITHFCNSRVFGLIRLLQGCSKNVSHLSCNFPIRPNTFELKTFVMLSNAISGTGKGYYSVPPGLFPLAPRKRCTYYRQRDQTVWGRIRVRVILWVSLTLCTQGGLSIKGLRFRETPICMLCMPASRSSIHIMHFQVPGDVFFTCFPA